MEKRDFVGDLKKYEKKGAKFPGSINISNRKKNCRRLIEGEFSTKGQFKNSPYSAKMDINRSRVRNTEQYQSSSIKNKHLLKFPETHLLGKKEIATPQIPSCPTERRKLLPAFREMNIHKNTNILERGKTSQSAPEVCCVENNSIDSTGRNKNNPQRESSKRQVAEESTRHIPTFLSRSKKLNDTFKQTRASNNHKETEQQPLRRHRSKRRRRRHNKSILTLSKRQSEIDSSEENKTSEEDLYVSSSDTNFELLNRESFFKSSKNVFQLRNQLRREGLCCREQPPRAKYIPASGKLLFLKYSKHGAVNLLPYFCDVMSYYNGSDNKSKYVKGKPRSQAAKPCIEPQSKAKKTARPKSPCALKDYSSGKNPKERKRRNNAEVKKQNYASEALIRGKQPMSSDYKTLRQKVTDEELWKMFQIKFRSYTTTKRHSGEVIPHYISTRWLKSIGVIDEFITDKEAEAAFKRSAGQKITMNVHEYKDFIIFLTTQLKLPFYALYRRMCVI